MLTLYFSPGASSMATHIALNEIGAPFELNYIPLHQHANREAGYLGVNPEGKVPTLMIDGRPLTEVAATLWYLARRYPEAGLLPQYGDIDGEARVISWMSFIASTIHPPGSPHRQRTLARGRRTAPWPQRVDRRSLFDRRYPPVPAVLAVCRCAAPRARDLPRPLRALRPHDGAAGGAEDAEGGGDGRLQFAGVRAPSHLRCISARDSRTRAYSRASARLPL